MLNLKRLMPAAIVVAAATLAMSGCGGDSSGGKEAPPANTTGAAAQPAKPDVALTATPVRDTKPEAASMEAAGADKKTEADTVRPVKTSEVMAKVNLSDRQDPNARPDTADKPKTTETVKPDPDAPGVVLSPVKLDLGQIPTNDAKSGFVKLLNTGDTPRTVLDCKTSCGCTTANCQKGKVLEPGEEMEVEIKLSGGTRETKLNKTVTFVVSDQPPIMLPVSANAVAFVTVTPDKIDRVNNPEGKLTFRSIDGEPFTIRSMFPPVIEDFSTEPAPVQEVYLSWEKWDEAAPRSSKLLFNLDHPKCAKTYGEVDQSEVKRPNKPDKGPAEGPGRVAKSRIDLDKLLMDGKTDEVLSLLAKGEIDVSSVDASGQSPLVKAARWGDATVIQAMLDKSADIAVGDRIGRTPLMYACQSKNIEAVRVLLDNGADQSQRDTIGNTALCWAAGFGNAAIVSELLEAGAEVEVSGPLTGFTPLIWASGFGEPESVEVLLKAGANIEAADVLQGATPLMNAVRTGGVKNVKVLLEHGAKLEAHDNEGKTPLLIAASNAGADAEMIHLLVAAGADLNARTNNGKNALDLAEKRTDLRAEEVLKALQEVMPATPEGE